MTTAQPNTRKLSVEQVAALLHRSERTVFRWLQEGKLPSLDPEDVRNLLLGIRKPKKRPRGIPFGDPRRYANA